FPRPPALNSAPDENIGCFGASVSGSPNLIARPVFIVDEEARHYLVGPLISLRGTPQENALKVPADATFSKEESRRQSRLRSVDTLRGLVMVIMALDHVRWFFTDAYSFDPTDLTQTSPSLFFTRWITHFCAPVFVFLAGAGAFLSASGGKTRKSLAVFLLSRGLWLVALDLVVVHTFGWWFNVNYHLLYGDVLWAL